MTKSIELSCGVRRGAVLERRRPRGGGAAAFVGAVGAGLGHMVGCAHRGQA